LGNRGKRFREGPREKKGIGVIGTAAKQSADGSRDPRLLPVIYVRERARTGGKGIRIGRGKERGRVALSS